MNVNAMKAQLSHPCTLPSSGIPTLSFKTTFFTHLQATLLTALPKRVSVLGICREQNSAMRGNYLLSICLQVKLKGKESALS